MSRATNAKRFSKVMRDLARVPSRAAKSIAKEIGGEIQRSMDASEDPYGRAWRKKADGNRSQLRKTGRGRASIRVIPTVGAGFKITVGVLYMIYHQFGGASHLRGPGGSFRMRRKNKNFGRDNDRSGGRNHPPKRSFIPFDRVPSTWAEIVRDEIEKAAAKVLKRG